MLSKSESEVTMGTGPCIVDLSASSDEDDDDDVVFLKEFPPHLSHRPSKRSLTGMKSAVTADLVILEDLDNTLKLHFGAGAEKDSQKSSQMSSVLDDDCCVLDEDPSKVDVVKASCGNDADDLVMTGEVGHVACRDFPHARHLCVQLPFKTTAHTKFCPQCHCYACDVVAPCSFWGDGTRGEDHCHASDKNGERWKVLRQYNKTHTPGHSIPSNRQQVSPNGMSSAGKFDSSAQYCPNPPGYEGLLLRCKELAAQVSDLCSSSDLLTLPNFFGAVASTNNSRGFSQSPHVNTGNIESTSFRELLGCHSGDSARSHHPLQIMLNPHNWDPSSHPRRYHSLDRNERTKFPRYVQRKDSHTSSMYPPYQSEGGRGCPPRRSSYKNVSFPMRRARFSAYPGPVQSPLATLSTVLPIRPASVAVMGQESLENMVPDLNTDFDKSYLRDMHTLPSFIGSYDPEGTEELMPQFANAESYTLCPSLNFSSPTLNQKESDASGFEVDATTGSCNSVLDIECQSIGETVTENKLEENVDSLPMSPPLLLSDYLCGDIDLWNDYELLGNFV